MARVDPDLTRNHRLPSAPQIASPAAPSRPGHRVTAGPVDRVLHIAGVVNEGVHSFLAPALQALADAGYEQTLILLDTPRYRHLIQQLPSSVRVCAIEHGTGLSPHHWPRVKELASQLLASEQFSAVHVHGFRPWAFGLNFGRKLPDGLRLFYTPHGSRTLQWLHHLGGLSAAFVPRNAKARRTVIAAPRHEVKHASLSAEHCLLDVDAALDDRLFTLARSEHSSPMLMSGDWQRNTDGLEQFCQIAVMLSAQELEVGFHWVGYLSNYARARLHASNVQAHAISGESGPQLEQLAQAWCHIAPHAPHGFPVVTASAMAMGMPVVAFDCPAHRAVITHGQNGLLFQSLNEALLLVSSLLDNPELRAQLGQAARRSAQERWSRQAQQAALVQGYKLG